MCWDVLIAPDEATGLFLAEVPDLPGCFSQGETEEQATLNVRDAIILHVQTLRDLGQDVPQPSTHLLRTVDVAVA